ncbi:MAG: ADP-glyceromanno-heptose 6-epimerase [Candidatus Omnitrophica bacterium]|jgi:ADP-L-glycero-D-manno-heptose 6-epimerase|nr:ADP-glyceromanno-heptose 6-epimerase [Candidatus Omnitrophota bacterium]MDD5079652.1 ADP-glyceromanno-heptose 6-epimerase [Candidatus Omnitrophota bacterium]
MRVVVTGGAGFIGSCLIHKLNEQGIKDIIVVDHLDESLKWKNLVGKAIEDYIAKEKFLDALESAKLKASFDFIIHMGACSSTTETDGEYLMENNYLYSKRLAKWALAKKVPFLYASSAATYGDGSLGYSDEDSVSENLKPLNLYGYSKQLFDLWLIRNGLTAKVTGFKFFNVFGPNEYHKENMRSVIAKVFDGVSRGEKMRLFRSYVKQYPDGEQKRDFIYVKDAVDIVYYFMEHPDKKGIFNAGTGSARSWNDLARGLFAALGRTPQIEYIDMPEQIRDKYQYFTQADLGKLRKAGYAKEFRTLEEAIADYSGYLKNNSYL